MKKHFCKKNLMIGFLLIGTAIAIYLLTHRPYQIIDTHEHIASLQEAKHLIEANKRTGISKTILVPTPIETLTLNGHKSFTQYRENTEELFKISKQYPDMFIPFCTVNPLDSDALEYLKSCIKQGGKGLKLYNGHSYYHDVFGMPLDNARMHVIYSLAERERLPLLFHINITKYQDELDSLLQAHPDLVISIPHFMVSSIQIDKVAALMDKYPNLYTDISFGSPEFMAAGFRRISKNPGKYIEFAHNYADRILFGADLVLTESETKDADHIEETINCYMKLLSERRFTCELVSDYYKKIMLAESERFTQCEPKEGTYCESVRVKSNTFEERYNEVLRLNGLGLNRDILQKIYDKNPKRFLKAAY